MNVLSSMKSGLEAVLDAILPLRARSARTKARGLADLPLSPEVHELLGVRITALMDYRVQAVEDLIQSLKYDGSAHAAQLAAGVLADYLHEEIASVRAFSQKEILIVPVPLHSWRNRERGFNQIDLVVRALPPEFLDGTLATHASPALTRSRATKPQTKLSRHERLSNVAGAFAVSDPAAVCKAHVFLIDDVTTTGATLVNAATPLHRAGAEVHLLALARA